MKCDLISESDEAKCYCRQFVLWPRQWGEFTEKAPLDWSYIEFKKENLSSLPELSGVYAFVVKPGIASLSECNYLMYIGKADTQTLRKRCKQYFSEARRAKPRVLILRMLGWKSHLFLYYAPLDRAHVNIGEIEDDLLAAFIPPMNTTFPGQISAIAKDIYRT